MPFSFSMDQLFESGRRRAVEDALGRLATTQREAVCLCLLAGRSTAEVATIQGTSRAQVARLVAAGLATIAEDRTTQRRR